MKKLLLTLALFAAFAVNSFSQATSLTVDCQTPGWLSSKINYGDQLTVKNLKVTGYINGTDIQLLYDMYEHNLTGVIDLEDASIVKGGTFNDYPFTVEYNDIIPYKFFVFQNSKKRIQKLIYPKTLKGTIGGNSVLCPGVDSVIWTSTVVKEINFDDSFGGLCGYIYIPEGIETIYDFIRGNDKIVLPSTVKKITGSVSSNAIFYSFITYPEAVECLPSYGNYNENLIQKSTFYIPKGTLNNYLNSDFAKKEPRNNTFIEFYDVDSVRIKCPQSLYKGETSKVDVDIYPDANLVSWINYSVSDTNIVKISPDGTILAKEYGMAEIFATPNVFIDGLNTKTASTKINVFAHTEGIQLPSSMVVHIDETKGLNARTLPLGTSDGQIVYESSNPSIASVSEDGFVTGHKSGSCIVSATSVDGGHTVSCAITVLRPVEKIILDKHSLTMKVGETEKLNAQILPSTAENKDMSWFTSNEQSVTVDQEGGIKAINSGEAWIKAVSIDNPEAMDSCKVIVSQPVIGIELSQSTCTLNKIGDNIQLEAKVLPEDATNKEVKWSSSNESVCVVHQGKVVAMGYGICLISAITVEGGFAATCVVNVVPSVASLELDKHELSINVGVTDKLFVQISPSSAENKNVVWSSSNDEIVAVSQDGSFTAMKSGEAWIKAVSEGNPEAKDSCKVTVIQPVTGIELSQSSCHLTQIGESFQLEATVLPEDATNKEVRWSSSNGSVCLVSKGKVVATGYGVAVVMATTADGGFLATCTVTVEDTSAINDIATDNQDEAPIYDMMGCEVQKTVKGHLYIRNGRKFIAK